MGMEPLNSAMVYQVQPIKQVQNEKIMVGDHDLATQESVSVVNKIDKVVDSGKTNEKKEDEKKEDSQENRLEQNQQKQNEKMKKAVEQMNEKLQNSEAIFGIHEKTNRITIKIVNKDTKEIIKELPPEKTLDMIAKVWEMAGLLVDEKR